MNRIDLDDKKAALRSDLKEKLIQATLDRLEEGGIHEVRARDLAKEAGCAVGTIYNLVGKIDDLILLASAQTLREFRDFAIGRFSTAVEEKRGYRDLLKTLALAYIDYAFSHRRRWQANFELNFTEHNEYFEVYHSGQRELIGIIVKVLKQIAPRSDDRELASIARALWASVHGISMLAMSNPSNILPRDKTLDQCMRVVDPVIQSLEMANKNVAA